jgi:hypothetical protein
LREPLVKLIVRRGKRKIPNVELLHLPAPSARNPVDESRSAPKTSASYTGRPGRRATTGARQALQRSRAWSRKTPAFATRKTLVAEPNPSRFSATFACPVGRVALLRRVCVRTREAVFHVPIFQSEAGCRGKNGRKKGAAGGGTGRSGVGTGGYVGLKSVRVFISPRKARSRLYRCAREQQDDAQEQTPDNHPNGSEGRTYFRSLDDFAECGCRGR